MTDELRIPYPLTLTVIRAIKERLNELKAKKRYERIEVEVDGVWEERDFRVGTQSWLAARVGIKPGTLSEALRQDERASGSPRTSEYLLPMLHALRLEPEILIADARDALDADDAELVEETRDAIAIAEAKDALLRAREASSEEGADPNWEYVVIRRRPNSRK